MTTHSLTEEVKAILAALVGGARYGLKIRLPHALVMTLLFRHDLTSSEKVRTVLRLAKEHALHLGAFATVYKTVLALLKLASRRLHMGYDPNDTSFAHNIGRYLALLLVDGPYYGQRLVARPPGHPERHHHALVAGAVGGYFVWGRYSSVNHQIVLYLASRVLVGLGKRFLPQEQDRAGSSYPLFAATVWGIVMMLFEESPHVLQPSLKKSMDEIYRFGLKPKASQEVDGHGRHEIATTV